ncbi:MAG: SDR family oxidoreductase [Ignavibacteria bacterium]|jgi:3-oxoacyl-[acyl-carrier protein] reductase
MGKDENFVWITGAGTGIGRELTKEFYKNGKNLILTSRGKETLERLRKEIEVEDKLIDVIPLDVSNSGEVIQTAKKLEEDCSIECLVNNAGLTSYDKAEEDSVEQIKEIIETNLLGAIFMIKAVLPQMIERKRGTIINILSVVTKKIFPNSSAYSASKSGLLAYTNVLREELRERNIRIINVIPGATKTPIWPNNALEKFSDRMMKPENIAKIVYDIYSIDSNMVVEDIVLRPIKGDL